MSVRSKIETESDVNFETSVKGLRKGATNRLMAERARQMKGAANQQRVHLPPAKPAPRKPSSAFEAWPLPGLAPMTRVRTSFGDVHAAALRKGDEVLTRSGRYLPILWLNRIRLDAEILVEKPDCNPVVLGAGTLGPQVPSSEIMLSPRQVVCVDDANRLSANREAAMLVSWPGIRRLRETSLSYTMFHLGQAAEVYCEGTYLLFPMDA